MEITIRLGRREFIFKNVTLQESFQICEKFIQKEEEEEVHKPQDFKIYKIGSPVLNFVSLATGAVLDEYASSIHLTRLYSENDIEFRERILNKLCELTQQGS